MRKVIMLAQFMRFRESRAGVRAKLTDEEVKEEQVIMESLRKDLCKEYHFLFLDIEVLEHCLIDVLDKSILRFEQKFTTCVESHMEVRVCLCGAPAS